MTIKQIKVVAEGSCVEIPMARAKRREEVLMYRVLCSALLCALWLPAVGYSVEYDAGPAVAFKHFEGSGPQEIWGKGLSDMVEVDIVPLAYAPEFADCEMAIIEWKRRDELIKELAFQQSDRVDPATRLDPNKMIDPNVFVDGSVSTTEDSVSWTINVRSAADNSILRTDTGTVPSSEAFYISESIAWRIASFLCNPAKPLAQPEPPPRLKYSGTVDVSVAQQGMTVTASGLVWLREDSPGSGGFSEARGYVNVSYQVEAHCTPFNGVLPLGGAMQLDAPVAGQHMLALMPDPFEISCLGSSLPQDIAGLFAACAPGIGGADDRVLQGVGACEGVSYRWQLSRR